MKTEGDPSPAEKGGPSERKITLKEKAAFQLKEFLAMVSIFGFCPPWLTCMRRSYLRRLTSIIRLKASRLSTP